MHIATNHSLPRSLNPVQSVDVSLYRWFQSEHSQTESVIVTSVTCHQDECRRPASWHEWCLQASDGDSHCTEPTKTPDQTATVPPSTSVANDWHQTAATMQVSLVSCNSNNEIKIVIIYFVLFNIAPHPISNCSWRFTSRPHPGPNMCLSKFC